MSGPSCHICLYPPTRHPQHRSPSLIIHSISTIALLSSTPLDTLNSASSTRLSSPNTLESHISPVPSPHQRQSLQPDITTTTTTTTTTNMSAVQRVARRTLYTSMRQFARSFEAHPQPISMTGSQKADWGRIVKSRGKDFAL